MTTTQALASNVDRAIRVAERSRSWVARKARMSPTSLARKLSGETDFTMPELSRVAAALGHSVASLLPDESATETSEPAA